MMLQPTPQQPPRRTEKPTAPSTRPEARYEALRLAVSLAGPQTPTKAITHMADAFEAWLTRPLAGA